MKKLNRSIMMLLVIAMMAVMVGCSSKKDTGKEEPAVENQTAPTETVTEAPTEAVTETPAVTEEPESKNEATVSVEKMDISIGALKGPTAMGMAKIIDDAKNGLAVNNYQFTITEPADAITAGLLKGEIQIAALPCNLASVLYNKSNGAIKVAGINTLGVLYIVETGEGIKSVEDLKGKTIYMTGKGATPEYTLRYLLTAAGMDPDKDVNLEFKSEPAEVAAILETSEDSIAMLPQPYVTTVMMKNDKVRIALSVEEEWNKVTTDGSSVITGVVVVNSKFLEEHEDAVKAFLAEYAKSVTYVQDNAEEASKIIEEAGVIKAAVAQKALPFCGITLITGNEMKEKVEGYLNALYLQQANAVGGAMPAEEFYYISE